MTHASYFALETAARKLAAFAALTLICATGPSQAANGGGGGGTGGGTIFYTHTCCRQMWTMNSDGTSQTQLGLGAYGPVSTQKYNGHYFFMDARPIDPPEYYPNGDLRLEVFALRDDYDQNNNNNSATRVQLTNDITLQTSYASGDPTYNLQWMPGGQKISIKARRWSGGLVSEGGIYTASLQFGTDGNITGLIAQPGAVAIAFPLDSNQWPNFRSYGWDPTSSKIAYEDTFVLGTADLLGSPHTVIYNGWANTPQWSPDGKKIMFMNVNFGISTIGPDGKALKEILRRGSSGGFARPFWSPTGSNVVCYGTGASVDIFRADSNGNFLTNLTNTPSDGEITQGWR
jgi:hypothetical protein